MGNSSMCGPCNVSKYCPLLGEDCAGCEMARYCAPCFDPSVIGKTVWETEFVYPTASPPLYSPAVASFALAEANMRQLLMQSMFFSIISLFSCVLCPVAAAYVVTFHPEDVPCDFEEKGSLSNVSQDVTTPHG